MQAPLSASNPMQFHRISAYATSNRSLLSGWHTCSGACQRSSRHIPIIFQRCQSVGAGRKARDTCMSKCAAFRVIFRRTKWHGAFAHSAMTSGESTPQSRCMVLNFDAPRLRPSIKNRLTKRVIQALETTQKHQQKQKTQEQQKDRDSLMARRNCHAKCSE